MKMINESLFTIAIPIQNPSYQQVTNADLSGQVLKHTPVFIQVANLMLIFHFTVSFYCFRSVRRRQEATSSTRVRPRVRRKRRSQSVARRATWTCPPSTGRSRSWSSTSRYQSLREDDAKRWTYWWVFGGGGQSHSRQTATRLTSRTCSVCDSLTLGSPIKLSLLRFKEAMGGHEVWGEDASEN